MKTRPHSKTVLCTGHVLSFACHLTQQAAHGHATSTWLNSTYVYRSIVDAVSSMKLDMMVWHEIYMFWPSSSGEKIWHWGLLQYCIDACCFPTLGTMPLPHIRCHQCTTKGTTVLFLAPQQKVKWYCFQIRRVPTRGPPHGLKACLWTPLRI